MDFFTDKGVKTMNMILKFIINNIKEKKFRTFLIIISITLSSALFFAAMAISDTVAEMYLMQAKSNFGSAEIMVSSNEDSPGSFFRTHGAEEFNDQFEYIAGVVNSEGKYNYKLSQTIPVNIRGYKFEELQEMNPLVLSQEQDLFPFEGKKIIISQQAAEKYNLKLGSSLKLNIEGYNHHFIISGIALSRGVFRPQPGMITGVVPRDKLASLFGARGKVSSIYVKTKPGVDADVMMNKLSREYERYTVNKTLTRGEMKEVTSMITTPFKLLLPLVVLISIFIIYTSFKVITMERLPVVGTFRSIGATRKMTDFILLGESTIYGIIGGLLGCGLGLGILYIMKQIIMNTAYMEVQTEVEMVYSIWQLGTAFIGAVLLSVISSLIPVIRVARISVKDIVLNNIEGKRNKKSWETVGGFLLILIGSLIPFIVAGKSWALIIDVNCMLVIGVGIVLLVPWATNIGINLLEKIHPYIFGNEGLLAVKNLRDNKSAINNVVLLTIGIASLLMINTVSYSTSLELVSVYNDALFEINGDHPQAGRRVIGRLQATKGVEDVYGCYRMSGIEVSNYGKKIANLYGVEGNIFFDYWDLNLIGDEGSILKNFSEKRSIILSTLLKERFQVERGDVINLKTSQGEKPYKITGFVNTVFNGGNVGYATARYLKRDMEFKNRNEIYIKTYQEPDKVVEELKNKFSREDINLETVENMQKRETKMWSGLLILMKGFSVITMLIGIFGIFNNFMVEYLSRRRTLAVIRSVGMSRGQTFKMMLIEAATCGLFGGIVGCFGGWLFIILMGHILKTMNIAMPMHYSPQLFLIAVISGLIISILSSINPSWKSAKANIIEAIKYE